MKHREDIVRALKELQARLKLLEEERFLLAATIAELTEELQLQEAEETGLKYSA